MFFINYQNSILLNASNLSRVIILIMPTSIILCWYSTPLQFTTDIKRWNSGTILKQYCSRQRFKLPYGLRFWILQRSTYYLLSIDEYMYSLLLWIVKHNDTMLLESNHGHLSHKEKPSILLVFPLYYHTSSI